MGSRGASGGQFDGDGQSTECLDHRIRSLAVALRTPVAATTRIANGEESPRGIGR